MLLEVDLEVLRRRVDELRVLPLDVAAVLALPLESCPNIMLRATLSLS